MDSKKPAPSLPRKNVLPQKPKINEIKNIDRNYYRELETLYGKYQKHPGLGQIPSFHTIRKARMYKDNSGNITGYLSLEEYIDNNHPLWCDLRNQFNELLLHSKPNHVLADFVTKQWNSGFPVNSNRNLSCLPRQNWRNRKDKILQDGNVTHYDQILSHNPRVDQTIEDKKDQLMAVYKKCGRHTNIEREKR